MWLSKINVKKIAFGNKEHTTDKKMGVSVLLRHFISSNEELCSQQIKHLKSYWKQVLCSQQIKHHKSYGKLQDFSNQNYNLLIALVC